MYIWKGKNINLFVFEYIYIYSIVYIYSFVSSNTFTGSQASFHFPSRALVPLSVRSLINFTRQNRFLSLTNVRIRVERGQMPNLTSPDFCCPHPTRNPEIGGDGKARQMEPSCTCVYVQIPVDPCLTRAYTSFSRHMTYRRDYLDVDLSLRFDPITHREYIYIYIPFSPPCVSIDHRCARDFSSRFPGQKKIYSTARLKSHPVIWERASFSSVHLPFTTRFPRINLHHAPINLDTRNLRSDIAFSRIDRSSRFLIWEC